MRIRPILIFAFLLITMSINILPEDGAFPVGGFLKVAVISFVITFVIEALWRLLRR